MNSLEIRAELDGLLRDKNNIQSQISEAKRRAAETGDYSDSDWFSRAEYSSKAVGRKMQQLQYELSEALKNERRNESLTFERSFMVSAKRILPTALYDEIMKQTVAETVK